LAQLEVNIQRRFAPNGSAPGFALDISLDCEAGVTVLFGASGSGKTLTLEALAGFLRPDAGRILLHNEILFDSGSRVFLPPQRRGVGYVFQNYALFPHMTVEENLAFGIARLPSRERHRRVREMLELFGLATLGGRRPHELSGGEKQRASIARALIPQPRLLLLDEPARGLDHPLRMDFYAVVRNLRETYRIPILLVTHDVTEGFVLADKIAVYRAGRIVQTGSPDEVFLRPRNPAVARLLGISNIFSGTIEELDPMSDTSVIRTAMFSIEAPYLPGKLKGDSVSFCIPREQVTLLPRTTSQGASKSDRERENQIPVRVAGEITTPSTVRLLLGVQGESAKAEGSGGPAQIPVQIEAEISRAVYKKTGIASEKDWLAALPKAFIHVFPEQGE
jgi:molybdate transport system ATP-binding protein